MKHKEPENITKDEFEELIQSNEPVSLCHGIIDAAFHINDPKWLEDRFVVLAKNSNRSVSQAAVTAIGHNARINKFLSIDVITPLFRELFATYPSMRGIIEDAVEDIEMFTNISIDYV